MSESKVNYSKIAGRLMFMSFQLRGEAERQPPGQTREDLKRGAVQLTHAFRSAYDPDPVQIATNVALIQGAIDYLVDVMTARYERELKTGEQR